MPDDDSGVTTLPPEITPECCPRGGGGNAGTTPRADNTAVLSPWIASCDGGGTVPSASDILNSEDYDALDTASSVAGIGASDATGFGSAGTSVGITEVGAVVITDVGDTATIAAQAAITVAVSEVASITMTGAVDVPSLDATAVAATAASALNVFTAAGENTTVAMSEVASVTMTGVMDVQSPDTTAVAVAEASVLNISAAADENTAVAMSEVADLVIIGDATMTIGSDERIHLLVMVPASEETAVAIIEAASSAAMGDTEAISSTDSLLVGVSDAATVLPLLSVADSTRVRVSENEMALLNLQGGSLYPTAPAFATSAPAFVNSTLNDGVDRVAVVFRAPKTGTLHSFQWRQNSNATPPTNGVRYAFQDPDGAGDPDGTDDQFRDVTTGLGAGVWLAPPGPITSDGTDSGTKRSVTANEKVCAVVYLPTFVAGSVTFSGLDLGATGISGVSYMDIKATTWAPNPNTPCMVLRYDDDTYVTVAPDAVPALALNTTTFNSGSTPDERGLRLTLPMRTYVVGAWVRLDLDAACDVVLYDSDGTSVLASASLDSTARLSTTGATCVVRFDPVLLLADTVYRLVVKPTSVSNVSTYDYDVTSTTVMAATPGGASFSYTSRTNAGAWDDSATTKKPWVGLLIAGMSS